MEKQDFSVMLVREAVSTKMALLALIEKKDRLLYHDAPALQNEYMVKIGSFEEEVIEAELDVSMLDRKIELIQAAINQRRSVNMDEIEKQIATERERKVGQLESGERAITEFPSYSDSDQNELQTKYRSIVRDFHPKVNRNITDIQRELYEKAVEAYKRQNLEAIRLIYDMLYDKAGTDGAVSVTTDSEDEITQKDIQEMSNYFATDFSLAAQLYPMFVKTESDAVFWEKINETKNSIEETENEINGIISEFPFVAEETLKSEEKTNEYLTELSLRLKKASAQKEILSLKIEKMTKAVHYG